MNQPSARSVLVFLSALFLARAVSSADTPAATQPAVATTLSAQEPADQSAPKLGKTGTIEARFRQLHDTFVRRGIEAPMGVLFIGDSITEGWLTNGKQQWKDAYFKYVPANFGIGGDRTQHVLWRIANGELNGIHPKVVVLMIGTNNIGNSSEEVLRADTKIVTAIHEKLPETKLLLLGIFPRGMNPTDAKVAGMRDKIKTVNEGLSKLDDGSKTRYLDIGDKFLNPDGVLPKDIMPDALHPNAKGYQIWVDAMQPLLDEMWK